jgi:anti-sigma factor RsiW
MNDARSPGLRIRCEELVQLITDYLEGAVDEDVSAEIEAHLALCPGCEEYLAQMRTTIEAVGSVPVETLSDRARADLLAAFRDFHPRSDQER